MNKKTKLRLWFAIGGAGLFVIALLAVSIALLGSVFGGESGESDNQASNGSGKEAQHEARTSPNTDESDDGEGTELPTTKFDSDGFAEMAVTTDPREAAASAAAALWSVDTTKTQFSEDYLAEVLPRIVYPSPDYVGPEGQIHAGNDPDTGELIYGDPLDALMTGANKVNYNPAGSGWWWMLADQSVFQGLVPGGTVIEAHPIEVLDAEEVLQVDPSVKTESFEEMDKTPDKKGAFLERFWVRVEADLTAMHGTKVRYPASLWIYCDPPEEGDLCGVADISKDYPEQWRVQ